MSSNDQVNDTITYKYVIPDDLKDCFVNGVWGVVSPKGEIHMHLFSERLPIPNEEVHEIIDGDLQIEPKKITAGGDIVRLIQSSVVMDIPTAIALQKWLNDRIKYFIEMKKKGKENAISK